MPHLVHKYISVIWLKLNELSSDAPIIPGKNLFY